MDTNGESWQFWPRDLDEDGREPVAKISRARTKKTHPGALPQELLTGFHLQFRIVLTAPQLKDIRSAADRDAIAGRGAPSVDPTIALRSESLDSPAGGTFARMQAVDPKKERTVMIQATYKGIEIEMEPQQFAHGWKCDYRLIKHPGRTQTIHHGEEEFLTSKLARQSIASSNSSLMPSVSRIVFLSFPA
jgi:hypothetical protein